MTELVSVTTRVVVGAKVLGTTAVLTEASTGVQSIIDKALAKHALKAERQRGQRSFYRSILRAAVVKLDPMKPARKFGDRAEWATALSQLHKDGKLIYEAARDNIRLPEAAGPSSAPA